MSDSDMHEATFIWPEVGPNEVILTGSFDQWSSSFRLTKTTGGFKGVVKLPWGERVLYKFIVDGHWTIAQSQPEEPDEVGNINNVYECPSKPTLVQAASSHEKHELDTVESTSFFAQPGKRDVENIENENTHRKKIADIVDPSVDTSGHLREDDSQLSGDVTTANDMSTVIPADVLQPDFEEATCPEPAMDNNKSFTPTSPTSNVPAEAVDALTTAPPATSRVGGSGGSVGDFNPSACDSTVDKSNETAIIPLTEVTETVISVPPVVTETPTDFKQKTLLPTVPSTLPSEPTPADTLPERCINAPGPEEVPVQPVVASFEASNKNGLNQSVGSIDVIPGSSQPGKNASQKFPQMEPNTPSGTGKFGSTRKKRLSIFGKVKNLFS